MEKLIEEKIKELLSLIQEEITKYSFGDRPMSPPAWMLLLELSLMEAENAFPIQDSWG